MFFINPKPEPWNGLRLLSFKTPYLFPKTTNLANFEQIHKNLTIRTTQQLIQQLTCNLVEYDWDDSSDYCRVRS